MKKNIIFVAMLLSFTTLGGCQSSITSWELEQASEACEQHQGIYTVHNENLFRYIKVTCNDGFYLELTKVPGE